MTEETLFDLLLKTPEAQRPALLDRACEGKPELRRRVEVLLKADAAPAQYLAQPPAMDATTGFGGTTSFAAGDVPGIVIAGRYKLLEEIGEGGMGTVWMAQQLEPVKRLVAIKLIKAGMDSKAVLARFEAERQALAMMDHPNIAKVLDGGIDIPSASHPLTPAPSPQRGEGRKTGRPYFVMELVKGTPITKFCDERKLSLKERLELFVPVCQAIQHAHQKGVIHRDIKPSNVLIALYDDKPVPKVIDFGIAKATGTQLTEQTLNTGFGAIVGTPEYMSPEQASLNNLDIDTRSDVYALGVLLYELMTGTTPVDTKSLGKAAMLEVLRIVREVEAPKPSYKLSTSDALPSISANRGTEPARLSKLMKGELDWVVLKALEKDRTRRYDTANGLARDIQRYLADEVVEARPPSAGYRLRKFMKRHRGQVIAASLVMLALLAGIVGTTIGLIDARKQRQLAVAAQQAEAERAEGERQAKQKAEEEMRKARKQAEIAEAVKTFLEHDLIAQADPNQAGNNDFKPDVELKLKTALDRAVTRIAKRFEGKPLIEASIRLAIGKAYEGRGLYSEALEQQEKACELYRSELAHADQVDFEALVLGPYLEVQLGLITLYNLQRQPQKALGTIGTLEEQVRRSFGDGPEGKAILEATAVLRDVLEEKDEAKALKKSQEIWRKMFGATSPEQTPNEQTKEMKDVEKVVKATLQPMDKYFAAMKLMEQGKYPEAERALTQLIETQPDKHGALAMTFTVTLAEVYRLQGKNAEARASYETARDGIRKALGEDHPLLASCNYGLAQILLSEKKYDLAETEFRAALAFYEKRMPNDLIRFDVKGMLGAALMGQKKYAAAEPLLLAGYEGWKQQEKTFPATVTTRLPAAVDRLIEFYTETNKPDEAKKWQTEKDKLPKQVEKK